MNHLTSKQFIKESSRRFLFSSDSKMTCIDIFYDLLEDWTSPTWRSISVGLSSSSITSTREYVNALGSMANDEKYDLGFASDNRPTWKDGKTAVYLGQGAKFAPACSTISGRRTMGTILRCAVTTMFPPDLCWCHGLLVRSIIHHSEWGVSQIITSHGLLLNLVAEVIPRTNQVTERMTITSIP